MFINIVNYTLYYYTVKGMEMSSLWMGFLCILFCCTKKR